MIVKVNIKYTIISYNGCNWQEVFDKNGQCKVFEENFEIDNIDLIEYNNDTWKVLAINKAIVKLSNKFITTLERLKEIKSTAVNIS